MATINDPKIRKILNASLTQDTGLSDIQKRMLNVVDYGIETDEDAINPELENNDILTALKSASGINDSRFDFNNVAQPQVAQTGMLQTEQSQPMSPAMENTMRRMWRGNNQVGMMNAGNVSGSILNTGQSQTGTAGVSKEEQDLFDKILGYNKGLGQRTDALHGARTATNLGVLLNNILQPEGDSLPSQINLTRPDIQYDDTIRRKMVSEAGQQSNVAQMNAMKMGMRGAIPAISANMMKATNDANTQAQANVNEIQQKNAMLAAEIANKEIEANLTLSEKRIQDALMKNELRNKAISGQTDTTFRDLGKWQQQREAISQENMLADIFRNMPADVSGNLQTYMKMKNPNLQFGDDEKGTRRGRKRVYDELDNPLN